MKIKPIRTENDYEQALGRVEELWASPCGSPERDELHALEMLIEAYEEEHYPIDPPESARGEDAVRSIKHTFAVFECVGEDVDQISRSDNSETCFTK